MKRVDRSQQCKDEDNVAVLPVLDYYFISTNQIPFYRNVTRMHSWAKQDTGRKNKQNFRGQVSTGSRDKDQFVV